MDSSNSKRRRTKIENALLWTTFWNSHATVGVKVRRVLYWRARLALLLLPLLFKLGGVSEWTIDIEPMRMRQLRTRLNGLGFNVETTPGKRTHDRP